MLRSLFAGISGLRSNQTMLDVVGNNIANANTSGFKGSNVVFQDTLSQMLTNAGAPTDNPVRGGTNPVQVGLGVSVAGTTGNFTQGSAQVTGRATDLMIQGDGFFRIERNGTELYTRAGAFNWDADGNLVTLDGDLVLAENGDSINIPEIATDPNGTLRALKIGADGVITAVMSDGTTQPRATIGIANFANPEGLDRVGDTAFAESANSGDPILGVPGEGRMGKIMGGALEMSNVDLAQEFTNLIIAQRGFQATSRVITTSDSVLEELVNIKR